MADKDHQCVMEERVKNLECEQVNLRVSQGEASAYIKKMAEDVSEIKGWIKDFFLQKQNGEQKDQKTQNELVKTIIVESLKLATLCVTILGAIVGAVKILGK